MDKRRLYLEFLFVLFVVFFFFRSSASILDADDDDEEFFNRCPFIRNRLKNGRVKIRSRGRVAKFQCDSGYDLAGKRFATCVRGQWNNPIPYCVARGCPRRPYVSNSRVSEMFRGAVLTYECLPGYSLISGSGVIYCDGRRWSLGTPECEASATNPPTSCDFEPLDLCLWTHDPTHDFDWKRNQYATPSGHVGTGPAFDHTFGASKGGVYLYMETSSPRKPDDTARIFSPVYSSDHSGGCFSFWYHMYGENTGGLKVYIKPESQLFGELKPAWELYGDQGNEWHQEKVIVPVSEEDFQIIIEGIRGNGYLGDTAIDDVNLSSNICEDIDNQTESVLDRMSCRGRCKDPPSDSGCSCLDNCYLDENCCSDYHAFCSSTTNPDEIISETTTSKSTIPQSSESPATLNSTESVDLSTTSHNIFSTSELNTPLLSSSTEIIIPYYPTTTTTTQKPSTTPSQPPSTVPTTTTTTTPKPTTIPPKPTTTTSTTTTTTTTPKPTTTTTTTTPKPTTTTTTTTPKPTTTSTTPKPPPPPTTTTTTTTTTPKPTTTTTTTTPKPTTTTTTTQKPTTTTLSTYTETTRFTESEESTSSKERLTTTYEPETRRTYNLRPRYRTTSTTPMPTPRTTTKLTTKRTTTTELPTSKAPTTTQRSRFRLTTADASAFKEALPSKEASSKGQPTTAIVCVTLFVMAAVATASVFLFRKWKANKQSKMADDSELRFLSENEVVEFSDVCANDRHNIQQPMIG